MWDYNIVWNISWYSFKGIFQPSIHFLQLYPLVGSQSDWSLSQLPSGKKRNTPWISRQLFRLTEKKQQFTLTFKTKANFELPIHLSPKARLWAVGISQSTQSKPRQMGRKHGNYIEKSQNQIPLHMHFSAALKEQKKQKALFLSFTGIVNQQNGYNSTFKQVLVHHFPTIITEMPTRKTFLPLS